MKLNLWHQFLIYIYMQPWWVLKWLCEGIWFLIFQVAQQDHDLTLVSLVVSLSPGWCRMDILYLLRQCAVLIRDMTSKFNGLFWPRPFCWGTILYFSFVFLLFLFSSSSFVFLKCLVPTHCCAWVAVYNFIWICIYCLSLTMCVRIYLFIIVHLCGN